jgi:hypothetical protein
LAGASSADIALGDEAFAEFARRHDLPEFDYIGLHGIWSWISNENRAVIVDFVRRRLKVGGILYISYNTLPGMAALAPLRHLMTEHAELIGAEGHGIVNRINGAIDFIDKFIATNPAYLRANAPIAERFKRIKEQNRHYLAHEYFNRDWDPMHFGTLARWLAPAKVTFGCSANYMDHYDGVNLTQDQRTYLADIPNIQLRQSVRDFMVNEQFRRDYWVKGARWHSPFEQGERLRAEPVVLITRRSDVPLEVRGLLGETKLHPRIYEPILDLLGDHVPRTIGEMEQALSGKEITFNHLVEAVIILIGMGHLAPAQSAEIAANARQRTDRLNARLLDAARGKADVGHLASPITAGGISVTQFQQLFLLARARGCQGPSDWAQFAWHILRSQSQQIIKKGKLLETPEQNLAELSSQATAFAERLPLLTALQVA